MNDKATATKGARGVNETAEWLGVSPLSVRRAISAGKLSAVRMGRRLLIPEESAKAFLDSLPKAS